MYKYMWYLTTNETTLVKYFCVSVNGELRDFTVGLSDDPPDGTVGSYRICRKFSGMSAVVQDVTCDGGYTDRIGRHVIIQVPGKSKILSLCEVQVFGFIPGKNIVILLK